MREEGRGEALLPFRQYSPLQDLRRSSPQPARRTSDAAQGLSSLLFECATGSCERKTALDLRNRAIVPRRSEVGSVGQVKLLRRNY